MRNCVLYSEDQSLGNRVYCSLQVDFDTTTHLDQHSPAELSLHQRLGHPASSVSSRAIHLCVILSREGSTTVGSPATVSVNDDLTSSKASVTL
ncbi:hypothetical protein INR49_015495 [Caranx melampygus]|nr:hypothetical protein INR49_015495 [Caranx melampygus]